MLKQKTLGSVILKKCVLVCNFKCIAIYFQFLMPRCWLEFIAYLKAGNVCVSSNPCRRRGLVEVRTVCWLQASVILVPLFMDCNWRPSQNPQYFFSAWLSWNSVDSQQCDVLLIHRHIAVFCSGTITSNTLARLQHTSSSCCQQIFAGNKVTLAYYWKIYESPEYIES